MPSQIELLNDNPVTYEEALDKTFNVIHKHGEVHAKNAFATELWRQRESIAVLAKHHLGLGTKVSVIVQTPDKWLSGGFNLCVPVDVKQGPVQKKLLMKCPMPFTVAEANYPGSVDEKYRTEVGAYVWMQENCPTIRIPRLYGFGSSTLHFTHVSLRPWYTRLLNIIRRWISSNFYGAHPSKYVSTNPATTFSAHYLFLEFIGPETGKISRDWFDKLKDPLCRKRLFTGIASIMLEMAKVPQPKIGSFRFNNDCTISLDSRPMFASTVILESQGTPRTVSEGQTYTCTEPFVADAIALLDENFTADVAYSADEQDCRGQMAARVLLRAVAHHFIKNEYRNGPYVVQLTDFNRGNFFIDDDWNITCLFDLEYICALPAEQLCVPYWLTGRSIDGLTGDAMTEYDRLRQEFMQLFREKEADYHLSWPLSTIIEEMWNTQGVWFWHSLASVNGAYYLVNDHISRRYSLPMTAGVDKALSQLWGKNAEKSIETKVQEFEEYSRNVRRLFD